MANTSGVFVFSAQQPSIGGMDLDSGKESDINCSVKRARAEQEVLGRMNMGLNGSGSFKSKLMSMSAPNSWSGFGSKREKCPIDPADISISEGPNGPIMKLSPKLKEQLHKPWANALILKNMGRVHTLNFMISKLTQKWTLIGHWQLTDLGEGYFVARFQMKEDLEYVLTNGPWVIANQYLVVQKWKPNFVPGEETIQTMPIWVRLSKLPMEWMDADLLWNIGGMLGSMCKVDPITEIQARGRFARICVQIDISKPLLGSVNIDDRNIKIEYESLGLVCFKCGRYGHSRDNCRDGIVEPVGVEVEADVPAKTENPPYGPWMLVSYGKQTNSNYKGRSGRKDSGSSTLPDRNRVASRPGGNNYARKKVSEPFAEKNGMNSTKDNRGKTKSSDLSRNLNNASGSGSRFDILNEEGEVRMAEVEIDTNGTNRNKAVLAEITNHNTKLNANVGRTTLNNSKQNFKKAERGACVSAIKSGNAENSKVTTHIVATKERCATDKGAMDSNKMLRQPHKENTESVTIDNCGSDSCGNVNMIDSIDRDGNIAVLQTLSSFEVVASELEGALAVISE